jgi:O-antigen/teichoic acid export membrane protein
VQVAARALGLGITLALAAVLGAVGYGAYAWAVALVALLRVGVTLGRDRLVVREVAAGAARARWTMVRGVVRDSLRLVLAVSLAVGAAASVVLAVVGTGPLLDALRVALLLLAPAAVMAVFQGALQGLGHAAISLGPDALLRPVLFGALLGLAGLAGATWSPELALALQAAATGAAVLATGWLWQARRPVEVVGAEAETDRRAWHRAGVTMGLHSGLWALHQRIGLVLVGALLGAGSAGVYALASAGASVAAIPLAAAALPLSPLAARLHAIGEAPELARVVTTATRWLAGVTVLAAVALNLVAEPALGLVGARFSEGSGALALLCLAVVINAVFGANTLVLAMTGHERLATLAGAVGAGTAVLSALILIPPWGIEGAAAAMVISMFARNACASWFAWSRLGLDTSPLGLAGH